MAAALLLMAVQLVLNNPTASSTAFIWLDMDYDNEFVSENGSNKKNLTNVF